ncbi:hypothetical protein JCM11251_001363 [Rhodosporidiobolus azoricus]
MTSRRSFETDWSTFKDIAPSKDIHAPPSSPPSRPFAIPISSPVKCLSPPHPNSSSEDSSPLPPAPPPDEDGKAFGAMLVDGADGTERTSDARARVLEKLGLDEEGAALRNGDGGEARGKYVGLGLDLDLDTTRRCEGRGGQMDEDAIVQKLSTPDGASPPPPPSVSLPLPLAHDPSIPLPARLAGKVEAVLGRIKRDEEMVLDGRVREYGVEAVGLPGEFREPLCLEGEKEGRKSKTPQ